MTCNLIGLTHCPRLLSLAHRRCDSVFLLVRLLHAYPSRPVPLDNLLRLLGRRKLGISTYRTRLVTLLRNHLPPKLLPATSGVPTLIPATSPTVATLTHTPLFDHPGPRVCIPGPTRYRNLGTCLRRLLDRGHRGLLSPLLIALAALAI